jgi:hypothetical protein
MSESSMVGAECPATAAEIAAIVERVQALVRARDVMLAQLSKFITETEEVIDAAQKKDARR